MKKTDEHNINFGCRTDVGKVREHNEDSLFAQSPLFIVADGMGGHAAGEVASEIAIESMEKNAPRVANAKGLAEAVEKANKDVIKGAAEGRGKQGMGTTMTAAVIDGEDLVIAQVGDSRAYLLHQGKLQQLTRDHSLMADLIETGQITPAEARVHPNRSLITRALGSDPDMFADQYEIVVKPGDRLLLCSDGLSGMITDDVIEALLVQHRDPQECADELVDAAIANGGLDNITVIVADVTGFSAHKRRKAANKTKRGIIITIILALAIIIGAVVGGYFIVQNSAYLADDDGYVAIYKGVPGSFAGINLSTKVETTDVKIEDLRETTQEHFKDGVIKVEGLEGAERTVNTYREEAETQKANKQYNSKNSSSQNSQNSSQNGQNNNSANNTNSNNNNQNSANSNGQNTNQSTSN